MQEPKPASSTADMSTIGVWTARAAYVVILVLATLSEFGFDPDRAAIAERLARALSPTLAPRDLVDAVRNLTLFAGWGAVWAITAARARPALAIAGAVISGALLSASAEGLQLLALYRTASLVDVLTNTSGALAGALTILLLTWAARSARDRKSFVRVPAFVFALSYLAVVFQEAFAPLARQEMLPGAAGGPLVRFALVLRHLELASLLQVPALEVLLFLPLGAFGVAALVELDSSYSRSAALTTAAGVAAAAAGELLHAFVGQAIVLGALLTHAAGIAIGAWTAARWLPPFSRRLRGPDRVRGLVGGYVLIIALWALRPFLPVSDLGSLVGEFSLWRLVPLQAHAPRADLFSVVDVAENFALYLPLGATLRVWPLERRGWLAAFLPAVYLATLTELAQIFINGRYFDVTDILVAAAGAAIGWAAIRNAGYRPYGELGVPLRTARSPER